METAINQPETETIQECPSCGQKFEQPIHAELHSGDATEEYYACPRCFTKVQEIEPEKVVTTSELEESVEVHEEKPETREMHEVEKPEKTPGCSYYLGYLKKRDKSAEIPEGCFTCAKMIECI